MSQHTTNPTIAHTKFIAIALAFMSLVSLFAMLHHPSVASSEIREQIAEIQHEAGVNATVHGILLALTILISGCLTVYAQLRGTHKTSILLGLILYWLGSIAMVTAVLTSGFVTPNLADTYALGSASQLEVFQGLKRLVHELNQAFATFGTLCWCACIACWALDMFSRQAAVRLLAAISLVAALTISASLLTQWLSLSVFGMTLVMLFISAWHLLIAWLIHSHLP